MLGDAELENYIFNGARHESNCDQDDLGEKLELENQMDLSSLGWLQSTDSAFFPISNITR